MFISLQLPLNFSAHLQSPPLYRLYQSCNQIQETIPCLNLTTAFVTLNDSLETWLLLFYFLLVFILPYRLLFFNLLLLSYIRSKRKKKVLNISVRHFCISIISLQVSLPIIMDLNIIYILIIPEFIFHPTPLLSNPTVSLSSPLRILKHFKLIISKLILCFP